MKKNYKKGTVLIYTLVLVVLGVFMASVVLNVAVELSSQYETHKLESSLAGHIKSKGELSMKYARQLNTTGSGFVDILSCPNNISLSGSTNAGSVNTQLRFLSGSILCRSQTLYNGENLDVYFNENFTDLEFAQLDGFQVTIHSGSLSNTFGDSDTTLIDLGSSAYYTSDGTDDNFDSDNYNFSSTGTTLYPDNYRDNDDDSRRMIFGYVLEGSGLYNILWSNSAMSDYIQNNPYNTGPYNTNIGEVSSGYIHLDIDTDFRLVLYEIDKGSYNISNELIHSPGFFGSGQTANIGYIQDDLTLGSGTGSAYQFDFMNTDYALFIENTSSGALLYKMRGEEAGSGSGIYLNPLQDNDISVFSYLGSHVLVDQEGRLIGDQMEVFGLK